MGKDKETSNESSRVFQAYAHAWIGSSCRDRDGRSILWEVLHPGMMYGQKRKSDSVEDWIRYLEDQLESTRNTLRELVRKIEEIHGLDIDGDGRVG